MQNRLLLAGVFLFLTFAVSDLPVSPLQSTAAVSFHIIKPAAPSWEQGRKKDPATDTASLKQSNWYGEAMKSIAASEYHFKWEEKINAYCTPNRKNNLRFFYNEDGFTVEPRTTQIPMGAYDPLKRPDEIKYKQLPDWKVQFKLDKEQVGHGKWQIVNNKAEYVTDNITVQYINNEEGMRQNFIVQKPLSEKEELKINFSIKTKLKTVLQNNQLKFAHKKEGNVLNYGDLKVWDVNQKPLEAGFEKNGRGEYSIKVNTSDAVYPITIDPLSTGTAGTTDWIGDDADQAGAWFGVSVASAGDVNGDGYSDVIIGAYRYDDGVSTDEGGAFVYHGSATGLSLTPNSTPDDADQANAYFGYSVASAGDVNGDGYSDVIIGAYGYDDPNVSEGRAFVYHGSATGLSLTPNSTPDDADQAFAWFGISVASAGDVNGDGYSDVIIGAYSYDDGFTNEGMAFVYHGSAAGLSASPNSTPDDADQADALFGDSVSSAGDVNGDGYSDVIIGASYYDDGFIDEGRAFVYHGSAAGLSASPNSTPDDADQADAYFGGSVSSAGDVNGDGYSDVIIGADTYDDDFIDEGKAFVYHGSATGLSTSPNNTPDDADQESARFGGSIASAGDVNGDGYSDVIIGANYYDDDANINEGRAFVYHGSATGLSLTPNSTPDDADQAYALFGISVSSAGDVNGDGYSDVIIGAYGYNDGANADEGRAFVYHGSTTGINTTAASMVENNQAGTYMGNSVASAGDVNGDGYSDVIVGAPFYDNGQMYEGAAFVYHGSATGINTTVAAMVESNQINARMFSVASAGDVNGDGYSDVIVGASVYDNGQTNEGAAFVYHGSATGINTTAAAIVESNQAAANMGISVASAGDVNGDGYSDVIVGASNYDSGQTDEGAAFVYHGSATGINTTAAATVESNQAGALMGASVASAGDVNGDGYSDIIVGAYAYDNGQTNEGAAFVYHGSATGISTTAAAIMEGNQAGAFMGESVASAGDINGDGYSDVIVGVASYENGESEEGAAFGYYGSATGIINMIAIFLESDRESAYFGSSVASAGDVNGDGYSDLVIGSPYYDNGQTDEGVVFVYYGSATGIIGASMIESNQASAQLGISVASAGDVNGDGYSDVIVGANLYDNGQADEGAAFVYHGNSPGTNKRNNLRLYNQDLVTPISHFNITEPNLFGAGLFAKSPLGRVKGKLVWEVKRQGAAFSGNPITNSTSSLGKQPTFSDLGLTGVELKYNVQKVGSKTNKIRTRIEYDKVTAITGQVYGPWRYPAGYTMGAYGMNSIPLPITLISFNGQFINADDVQLNWITSNEINMQTYFVERSTDGINFTEVGVLTAKGIGSNRTDYSFTDKHVKHDLLYYRLKLKEKSRDISYTKIITVSRSKIVKSFIAPNPVKQGTDAMLVLQSATADNSIAINIFNSSGQLVSSGKKMLHAGRNDIILSTKKLPGAVYLVSVSGQGIKENYRLIVQ